MSKDISLPLPGGQLAWEEKETFEDKSANRLWPGEIEYLLRVPIVLLACLDLCGAQRKSKKKVPSSEKQLERWGIFFTLGRVKPASSRFFIRLFSTANINITEQVFTSS